MIEAVTTSPLFGIVLCIGTFQIGRWVQKKTGLTLANPLVIAILLCIGVLLIFDIPYEDFAIGGDIVNMMLGPCHGCARLEHLQPVCRAQAPLRTCFSGLHRRQPVQPGKCAAAVPPVPAGRSRHRRAAAQKLHHAHRRRHCRKPWRHRGHHHGGRARHRVHRRGVRPLFAKLMHVTEPVAEGFAIGACSHALGTTKAAELGEVQGR